MDTLPQDGLAAPVRTSADTYHGQLSSTQLIMSNGSDWSTEDAPYWRRHYGIGRQWQPRPGARRGCRFAIVGVFALLVVVLLVALLVAAVG
jgi:hypothetical protein